MRSTVTDGLGRGADVGGAPVYGQVGSAPFGSSGQRAAWFVGFQGGVAFAVLELTRSARASAAPVAGEFLRDLRAQS
jgi:hypothetical protein